MTKILTEVEARYEIAKLLKKRPEKLESQRILERKFRNCRNLKQSMKLFAGLLVGKSLEMSDVASDLNQAVKKLKKINLKLKSCN